MNAIEEAMQPPKPVQAPDPGGNSIAAAMMPKSYGVGRYFESALRDDVHPDDFEKEVKGMGSDPSSLRGRYEQALYLKQQKAQDTTSGRKFWETLATKEVPFVSAGINLILASRYTEAKKRYEAGQATPRDIETIAGYERRQEHGQAISEGKATLNGMQVPALAGQALNVAQDAPALVGEAMAGGRLLKPLQAGAEAGMLKQAATYAGKQVPGTVLMPSLYADQWAQRNIAANRAATDIRGLPPAFGMAYAQNLVLGQLQGAGNANRTFAGQVAAKGGIGLAEQQIADTGIGLFDAFTPADWQKMQAYEQRGGVGGALGRGQPTKALEQATVQMLTFSYFAGLHGKQPRPIQATFKDAYQFAERSGLNARATARYLDAPHRALADAFAENPNLTADEARAVIDRAVPGSDKRNVLLREYGYSLADAMPDSKETQAGMAEVRERRLREQGDRQFQRADSEMRAEDVLAQKEPERPQTEFEFRDMLWPAPVGIEPRRQVTNEPSAPTRDVTQAEGAPRPSPESISPTIAQEAISPQGGPPAEPLAERPVAATPRANAGELRPGDSVEFGAENLSGFTGAERAAIGHAINKYGKATYIPLHDADGQERAFAVLNQSGGTLHVSWFGATGLAGGEGRGDAQPFGAREMLRLLPDLAKRFPDAILLKYTPSEGRIKAGEAKEINLEKVREKMATRQASPGEGISEAAKSGVAPHVVQRAEAYLKSLGTPPKPPAEGMVRMYRGENNGATPHEHAFFSDERGLAGVAIPFAKLPGRHLVYVDVPASVAEAGLHKVAVTDGEYRLPEEYRRKVKPWGESAESAMERPRNLADQERMTPAQEAAMVAQGQRTKPTEGQRASIGDLLKRGFKLNANFRQEWLADIAEKKRTAPATERLPPQQELEVRSLVRQLQEFGYKKFANAEARMRSVYRQYGTEAYEGERDYYRGLAESAKGRRAEKLGVEKREETPEEESERVLREELVQEMDHKRELEDVRRQAAAAAERRMGREAAEKLTREVIREANESADAAVEDQRVEEAAQPGEPRQEPRSPIGDAVRAVFGDGAKDVSQDKTVENYEIKAGDGRYISVVSDGKTAHIHFANESGPASAQLAKPGERVRTGTMSMFRDLTKLVSEFAKRGIAVEYEAEPRRHEFYSRIMEKAGFKLKSSEVDAKSGVGTYTWNKPKGAGRKTDREKIEGLRDKASDEAKPYFEDALFNIKDDFGQGTAPDLRTSRKRDVVQSLGAAYRAAGEQGKPKVAVELRDALLKLGAKEVGTTKAVDYDGSLYEAIPGVGKGDVVVVTRRPIVIPETAGNFVALKGKAHPPERRQAETYAERNKALREQGASTLYDYIRGYGGIERTSLKGGEVEKWDAEGLKGVFTGENGRTGTNDAAALYEHLVTEGHLQRSDSVNGPDAILDALLKHRVVDKSHKADDAALDEHYRAMEAAARARGEDTTKEHTPNDDSLFAKGPLGTSATAGNGDGKAPSVYEINKTALEDAGLGAYVGRVREQANAAYLTHIKALELSGYKTGDSAIVFHEIGHHYALSNNFVRNLPPDVQRGIEQFDYDPNRPGGNTKLQEGFAEWYRRRQMGQLNGLTADQTIASQFAERWLESKGLTAKADKTRAAYSKFAQASPQERVRGMVSQTGKPVKPLDSPAEVVAKKTMSGAATLQDMIDDRFQPAARLDREATRLGIGDGNSIRDTIARIQHMTTKWADDMLAKGIFTWAKDANGDLQQKRLSKGAEWVYEGIDLKQREGVENLALGMHVVNEVERGARMIEEAGNLRKKAVTPDDFKEANELMDRGQKKLATADPEQVKEFKAYIDDTKGRDAELFRKANQLLMRFTDFHNSIQQGRVAIGAITDQAREAMFRDYPDYMPLSRVMENEPYKAGLSFARKGSGRQFISPLITMKAKLNSYAVEMTRQVRDQALWEGGENQGDTRGVGNFWKEAVQDSDLTQAYGRNAKATPDTAMIDRALEVLGIDQATRQSMIASMGPNDALAFLAPEKWKDSGGNYYTVRIDGKPIKLEIGDKSLYELLTHQQGADSRLVGLADAVSRIPGLAQLNAIIKHFATVSNMVFPIKNAIRDPWQYFQNAKGAGPFSLSNWAALLMGQASALRNKIGQLTGKDMGGDPRVSEYFKFAGEDLRAMGFAPRGEGEKAYKQLEGQSATMKAGVKAVNTVKDLLETWGFAEHGPRLAEWTRTLEEMGYTRDRVEAALKASPHESPIPLNVMVQAGMKAAQATTDFGRQGIFTHAWNKVVPFFGAHIAGLSQEGRNVAQALREARAGKFSGKFASVAGSLGAYLALEALHHFIYRDEDWYKELRPDQRYNWWVLGRTSEGGIWGVPKPQGLFRMAGVAIQESLREANDRGARPGSGAQDVATNQLLPNRFLPVVGQEAVDVMTNEDWRKKPIVPKRDEYAISEWDKWWKYRGPYFLEQLSGGLFTRRTPDEIGKLFRGEEPAMPFKSPTKALDVSKVEPAQSVDDVFEEVRKLEQQRTKALSSGGQFQDERRYQILHQAERQISELSRAMRGERLVGGRVLKGVPPSEEKQREIRKRQVEVAQKAIVAAGR